MSKGRKNQITLELRPRADYQGQVLGDPKRRMVVVAEVRKLPGVEAKNGLGFEEALEHQWLFSS